MQKQIDPHEAGRGMQIYVGLSNHNSSKPRPKLVLNSTLSVRAELGDFSRIPNVEHTVRGSKDQPITSMEGCLKFQTCSAPICPLDAEYLSRGHIEGEPVCFHLREWVKRDSCGLLRGDVPRELVEPIAKACPAIIARYAPIKKALKRASRSRSKTAAFRDSQKHLEVQS